MAGRIGKSCEQKKKKVSKRIGCDEIWPDGAHKLKGRQRKVIISKLTAGRIVFNL